MRWPTCCGRDASSIILSLLQWHAICGIIPAPGFSQANMAALATPHWEAATREAREALVVLGQLPLLRPFYLAGGTAFALRLGHRISLDLNLFANIETLMTTCVGGLWRRCVRCYVRV